MPCFRSEHYAPLGAPVIPARDFALPGDTAHYAPDRPVDVRHVTLDIVVDFASKTVSGTCATTVSALFDEVHSFTLRAAEMEIASVTLTTKRRPQPTALDFDNDGNELHITLDRPLRYGNEATITIEYTTSPR